MEESRMNCSVPQEFLTLKEVADMNRIVRRFLKKKEIRIYDYSYLITVEYEELNVDNNPQNG